MVVSAEIFRNAYFPSTQPQPTAMDRVDGPDLLIYLVSSYFYR